MRRSSLFFVLIAFTGMHCAPTAPPTKGSGPVVVAPVTPEVPTFLKDRIEAALQHVQGRDLETTYGFWTIFHAILGLGPEATTLVNPDTKERINAIDYICKGNPVRGLRFIVSPDGIDVQSSKMGSDIEIFVGQGHQDQFIAEMVQWGMSPDKQFIVNGKAHTFMDFVRFAKARASVTQKQELSWAILVIGQHYGTDIAWTNNLGEKLRFEDIVRYELKEAMDTAACGGTHRLFGLTWVLHLHRHNGGKVEGVWKDVAAKLDDHKLNAKKNKNGDGCFSTDYFKGKGDEPNPEQRIGTTGHILEWLSLYLPDSELKEAWLQEAAGTLAKLILESRDNPIEGGALYHATHGLRLYHDRVFGEPKAKRPYPLPVQ